MTPFIWFIFFWLAGLLTGFSIKPLSFFLPESVTILAFVVVLALLLLLWMISNRLVITIIVCLLGLLIAWIYMDIRFPGNQSQSEIKVIGQGRVTEARDWGNTQVLVVKLACSPFRLLIHHSEMKDSIRPVKGDMIHIQAMATPLQGHSSIGDFNPAWYWASKGVRYQAYHPAIKIMAKPIEPFDSRPYFFARIRKDFLALLKNLPLSPDNRAILIAMLTGNKQELSTESKALFSALGIMHLLAVSGLHLGLVYFLISSLLSTLTLTSQHLVNQLLSISVVWTYAFMCNLPPSAFRAATMISLLGIFRMIYRQTRSIYVVAATAFFHSLIHPEAVFAAGFQLSYLAVSGILLFYPLIRRMVNSRYRLVKKLTDLAAVSLSAQALTWPLTIYLFGQFPFWFILSNLVLAPIAILFFYIGLLLTIFEVFLPLPNWLYRGIDQAITLWISFGQLLSRLPPGVLTFDQFPIAALLVFTGLIWLFKSGIRFRIVHPIPVLILFILWCLYGFFDNFVANLLV